ncbi:MAG: T9SS type A sorting domain-containing protein [Saprospiraceae bacterium]|nr:T9SS type A sorting domain-containing protein [Saprospiraceae bacterium]
MLDASGHYDKVIIGGANDNLLADNKGPEINIFMDNENFKFGDQTSANPTLIVKLYDENGINVVGNSIGHDLEAILDDDTQNTLLLNDFYKSELDDYQRGEVRFPLNSLSPGRHSIRVSAWDVANNFSEAYTEFVVIEQAQASISKVMAFPNPLSEGTCFAFQHNLNNQALDVQISIYTVDGKLMKTINERILTQGNAVDVNNCIPWDGMTDAGKGLEKGVYIYTINANTAKGQSLNGSTGKLVVIR